MRKASSCLAAVLLLTFGVWSAPGKTDEQPPDPRTDALRKYGLDPASTVESRVRDAPASVLKMFKGAGEPAPTAHILTVGERRTLSAAVAALPPLHRRVLGERLRSLSFLDGMPNTALTSTVNSGEPYRLFDITFRAGVLSETVSKFLTDKERTCFNAAGSSLSVSIEAGTLDAMTYVLLHEATHVVDSSLALTPGSFTAGVWSDRTVMASPYRDPLLERIRFRAAGEVLRIDDAEAVYAALRRTPFVSLYASSNWHDDLAEFVAWHHLSEKLGQPYRIVIRDAGKEISAYEPMKSSLVRSRFDRMSRFYAALVVTNGTRIFGNRTDTDRMGHG